MNIELFERYGLRMLEGLLVTVELVVISVTLGALLALPIALARMSPNRLLRTVSFCYVHFFRGTPLLAQVFLVYYGSGQFRHFFESIGLWWLFRDAFFCAVFTFTLNTAAYQGEILRGALARQDNPIRPIYVIPGGQVMAAFVRRLEAEGGIGPLATRRDLFSDEIHFNDYGAYLMALTHFAVLYGRSPLGLPHALERADGSLADDPGPEAARAMQEVVWEIVTGYAPTGVAAP